MRSPPPLPFLLLVSSPLSWAITLTRAPPAAPPDSPDSFALAISTDEQPLSACWSSAVLLSVPVDLSSVFSSGADTCMNLTPGELKSMAYGLFACHLAENGRQPSERIINTSCDVSSSADPDSHALTVSSPPPSHCPSLLTDTEFGIYTQLSTHLMSICDKITESHWRQKLTDTQTSLLSSAASASAQLTASLANSHEVIANQDKLLEQQAVFKAAFHDVHEELHSVVLHTHEVTLKEMEEKHKEAISTANDALDSLSALTASIDMIEEFTNHAYSFTRNLQTAGHFLLMINLSFVLTSTPITASARFPLFLITASSAAFEHLASSAAQAGRLKDSEKKDIVDNLRSWVLLLAFIAVFLGVKSHISARFSAWRQRGSEKEDGWGIVEGVVEERGIENTGQVSPLSPMLLSCVHARVCVCVQRRPSTALFARVLL